MKRWVPLCLGCCLAGQVDAYLHMVRSTPTYQTVQLKVLSAVYYVKEVSEDHQLSMVTVDMKLP